MSPPRPVRSLPRLVACVVLSLALAGCMTPRSYLDPEAEPIRYSDLHKPEQPLRLALTTVFLRNGVDFPAVDPLLRENTEHVLRQSGWIEPLAADGGQADPGRSASQGSNAGEGEISVTVNNVADTGVALAKGIGTGLTFGLIGNTVVDRYEMAVTIRTPEATFTRPGERGALFSAVGNAGIPVGVELMAPGTAFARTIEQMLLRILKDFELSRVPAQATLPGDGALSRDRSPAQTGHNSL